MEHHASIGTHRLVFRSTFILVYVYKVINVCSELVTPQEMAPTLQCFVIYLLNAEQMWV